MKTAQKTKPRRRSAVARDAESLLDTVLRAPARRSHQLRLLAAKPSRACSKSEVITSRMPSMLPTMEAMACERARASLSSSRGIWDRSSGTTGAQDRF